MAPAKRKNKSGAKQLSLFATLGSAEEEDEDWGEKNVPQLGSTVLDVILDGAFLVHIGQYLGKTDAL